VEPATDFAQLQLSFVDQTQWRYEVIRPLVLFTDRTAQQRAHETETHPDTVRTLRRRFHRQGMLGLLPADVEVVPQRRASQGNGQIRAKTYANGVMARHNRRVRRVPSFGSSRLSA
jgi:hypothetical protein